MRREKLGVGFLLFLLLSLPLIWTAFADAADPSPAGGQEDAAAFAVLDLSDIAPLPAGPEPTPPPPAKLVALTFDDGPSVYTDSILNTLEAYGVRATFCVRGERVLKQRDRVLRAVRLGCEVIGHSWDHTILLNLPEAEIIDQILRPQLAIEEVTGVAPPMMYRAPGGTTSPRLLSISQSLGFMLVHWDVGSYDYGYRDAELIYEAIVYNVKDGSIVLCHDLYPETSQAMRKVIPKLLDMGYTFVTISELMAANGDTLVPGTIYHGHGK